MACGDQKATTNQSCITNSDCDSDLCVASTCAPGSCVVDKDCGGTMTCFAGGCHQPASCKIDSDCEKGMICTKAICVTGTRTGGSTSGSSTR